MGTSILKLNMVTEKRNSNTMSFKFRHVNGFKLPSLIKMNKKQILNMKLPFTKE